MTGGEAISSRQHPSGRKEAQLLSRFSLDTLAFLLNNVCANIPREDRFPLAGGVTGTQCTPRRPDGTTSARGSARGRADSGRHRLRDRHRSRIDHAAR